MAGQTWPRGGRLGKRVTVGGTSVAYDVVGSGPPVVLVHGTPSWSYLWRSVVPALSARCTVFTYDLPGYGGSAVTVDQDISLAAQAKVLAELVGAWDLGEPAVAGHDIGAGIVLRSCLVEGVRYSRIALLDAVVFAPWITPATRRIKETIEDYRQMAPERFEAIVAGHLSTATRHPMADGTLDAYLARWRGTRGRDAYLQHVAQFDEQHTAEVEPLLPSLDVPVRVLWGEHDAWLDPALARRLDSALPSSTLTMVADAGHFCMEDRPDVVSAELAGFFTASEEEATA